MAEASSCVHIQRVYTSNANVSQVANSTKPAHQSVDKESDQDFKSLIDGISMSYIGGYPFCIVQDGGDPVSEENYSPQSLDHFQATLLVSVFSGFQPAQINETPINRELGIPEPEVQTVVYAESALAEQGVFIADSVVGPTLRRVTQTAEVVESELMPAMDTKSVMVDCSISPHAMTQEMARAEEMDIQLKQALSTQGTDSYDQRHHTPSGISNLLPNQGLNNLEFKVEHTGSVTEVTEVNLLDVCPDAMDGEVTPSTALRAEDLEGKRGISGLQFSSIFSNDFDINPKQLTQSEHEKISVNVVDRLMNGMMKEIRLLRRQGSHSLEINLRPETLGKITLRLTLENGFVTAKFSGTNQMVVEVLEANKEQFYSALRSQGIEAGNLSFSVDAGGVGRGTYGESRGFSNSASHIGDTKIDQINDNEFHPVGFVTSRMPDIMSCLDVWV